MHTPATVDKQVGYDLHTPAAVGRKVASTVAVAEELHGKATVPGRHARGCHASPSAVTWAPIHIQRSSRKHQVV